jgi:hypothetical protein
MREFNKINNPYHDDKVIDACSIFGMMDTMGNRFSGESLRSKLRGIWDT